MVTGGLKQWIRIGESYSISGGLMILATFIFGEKIETMKYLLFNYPLEGKKVNDNFIKTILIKMLGIILPVANPDFENKIDDVSIWLIEFDEDDIPIREIGLKEDGDVILKMPFKKNYGFWTDNILKYSDFIERFSAEPIDAVFFNEKWNELE